MILYACVQLLFWIAMSWTIGCDIYIARKMGQPAGEVNVLAIMASGGVVIWTAILLWRAM